MHPSVRRFIAEKVEDLQLGGRDVLEVGGLNVNGSVRDLFTGRYVSTDMRPGRGVDVVCDAHDLPYCAEFEVVVCCEMLEHDSAPWVSLARMRRAVPSRGHLLLTCRGYDERGCFPLHGYPDDLWRYSCHGMEALLRHTGWGSWEVQRDPEEPGVFAVAVA